MKRLALVVVFAVLGLLPALVSATTSNPSAARLVAPPADQLASGVSIIDFSFQPMVAVVGIGSTVTWTNTGTAPHTVTADLAAFDSGILNPGASFSMTFTAPGAYAYHCAIHPAMVGTIQVS